MEWQVLPYAVKGFLVVYGIVALGFVIALAIFLVVFITFTIVKQTKNKK